MKNEKIIRVALVGNPNCGKTTLFNRLTGSNQSIGNWPGVTVEKKWGELDYQGQKLMVADLPGVYSLSPYSPEELITRDFLLREKPDVIINVVDASNLERNLYLTTQLLELEISTVVALNMMDVLEKRVDKIDTSKLSVALNTSFLPISAGKGRGLEQLLTATVKASRKSLVLPPKIYTNNIELVLFKTSDLLKNRQPNLGAYRWYAVKLLEKEEKTVALLKKKFTQNQLQTVLTAIQGLELKDGELTVAEQRYRFIDQLCSNAFVKGNRRKDVSISDRIDLVVTNRWLAIPLFFLAVFLVFGITFGPIGTFLTNCAEWLVDSMLSQSVQWFLQLTGASEWACSLVMDGVLPGVGAVISFLPQLALLFLLLSVLEDSGYMARAAFIMDKALRKIGLSGKAFVPLFMGFGCTVPAVMGTRILENEKDKRLTVLILPFMSCSAKMPVYALFVSAFFAHNKPVILFSIYLMGVVMAVLSALLFKNTILKGEPATFLMELPPYRLPTPKSLAIHVFERLKDFLLKAGTVLLGATVMVWYLQYFTLEFQHCEDVSQSILAKIGVAIAPIFSLCGFADWRQAVALLTGLIAKESVVSTMSILYQFGSDRTIYAALNQAFTPVSAYAFLIFVLFYTPCIAALSAIKREMGSLKWTAITVLYQLAAAWFFSAFFYQFAILFQKLLKF